MKQLMMLLAVLMLFATACGGHSVKKSTGIPVMSSQGFYFNMKQVALESGYDVSQNDENATMTIHVGKWGNLQYRPGYDDSIEVIAFVKNKGDESDASKEERAQKIMAIHDDLITRARELAKENEMFR